MDNKSLYEHEIKRLRGIIITLERLIKELDEDSTPPQSRPFERGDEVLHSSGEKYYVIKAEPSKYGQALTLINNDGASIKSWNSRITQLITPASDRKIQVGDTFSCSGRLIHGSEEFTAKQIGGHSVMDTNGHAHALKLCTFRSRPKPKPGIDPDVYVEMEPDKELNIKIKIRSMEKINPEYQED